MRIPYAAPDYGTAEIDAVVRVLSDPGQIVAGPEVEAFEQAVASLFGVRSGVMVNSGSSGNLLALAALDLPRGSRVATPACTFATTVAPIVQLGHQPVFVDVDPSTYQIDPTELPSADAYMVPRLLGNLPDEERIRDAADGEPVIVDACDTLGPETVGDVVTTSFYASHVLTCAGGGGMVCFRDPELADRAKLLANWGRTSTLMDTDDVEARYETTLGGRPHDAKFVFTAIGYNMQPLELQGAFGVEQLKRLPASLARRRENFDALLDFFRRYEAWFTLPEDRGGHWLAFPLTIRDGAPFDRRHLAVWLEGEGVQTRPVMAGNILRHPPFSHLGRAEDYPVSDHIMQNGLLVGCHQGLTTDDIDYMMTAFRAFLGRYV